MNEGGGRSITPHPHRKFVKDINLKTTRGKPLLKE
jgi:hypothetical protein